MSRKILKCTAGFGKWIFLVLTARETLSYRLNARRSDKQFCCSLDNSFKILNPQSFFHQDGKSRKCITQCITPRFNFYQLKQSINDRKHNLMRYTIVLWKPQTRRVETTCYVFPYIVHIAIVSLYWTDLLISNDLPTKKNKFFATLSCWKLVNKRTFKLFCLKKLQISF